MTKSAELITVGVFLIGFFMLGLNKYNVDNKNEELSKQLTTQEEKIKALKEFAKKNAIITDIENFHKLGLPDNLPQHYAIIYAQIDFLARLANIPEKEFSWIHDFMRKGLLHHFVNKIIFNGVDNSTKPPTIATQLIISIDWDKAKLSMTNPLKRNAKNIDISNQAIMKLANYFSNTVFKEKLTIDTSIRMIKNPSNEALNVFNIPIKTNSNKLDSLVMEKLNLINGEALCFREGDSVDMQMNSDYTPELFVKFKYIKKKNLEK